MADQPRRKPFAPYPWQQAVWERLKTQWQSATLPHGMLFAAPAGLGYAELASSWAAFLFCESSQDRPCHHCRSCRAVHDKRHASTFFVDGAATGVQEVRMLHADLMLAGHGMRVVVVNHAEALTTAAVNAWLKCLEDPPERTLFLMLATRASALPATLRSRLVRHQIAPATSSQALQVLQPILADTGIPISLAKTILACEGGPLAAWDAIEHGLVGQLQALEQVMTACSAGRLSVVEAATQRPTGLALEHALHWIIWTVTQHIMACDVHSADSSPIQSSSHSLPTWLQDRSLDGLLVRHDGFVSLHKRVMNNRLTEKLAWEMLFLTATSADEEIVDHGFG